MSVVCDPAPLKVAVAASVLGFSMVFLCEVICAVVQTRPVAYRRVSVTPLRLVVRVFMWHIVVLQFDSNSQVWLLRRRDGSVAVAQVLDSVCL